MVNFQHNRNVVVNKENYKIVYDMKRKLMSNLHRLFTDLKIKYVIAHGNLIEYVRCSPIYHDDDIDLRLNNADRKKWFDFCSNNERELKQYDLKFDGRFKSPEKQMWNGIQAVSISDMHIKIDVHADVVFCHVGTDYWPDYNIDFNNIQLAESMGCFVYVPYSEDTKRVLKQYGDNYLIPKIKSYPGMN